MPGRKQLNPALLCYIVYFLVHIFFQTGETKSDVAELVSDGIEVCGKSLEFIFLKLK